MKICQGVLGNKLKFGSIFKIFFSNRHSRQNGYFRKLNAMSSCGKKLVYQFGPKSIQNCDWLQEIIEN